MNPRTLAHLDPRDGGKGGFSLKGPQNAGVVLTVLITFLVAASIIGVNLAHAATGSSGTLSCTPTSAELGTSVQCNFSVTNTGDSSATLNSLVRIFPCVNVAAACTDAASGAPLDIKGSIVACSAGSSSATLLAGGS